jgi:WD40 repeat protein
VNTGATESITKANAGQVRELARLGRGWVSGTHPGSEPNTAVILSDAGAEIYDTAIGQTVRWLHQIDIAPGDAVSPDGRLLVSRRDDKLRLWDLADGQLLCAADVAAYQGIASIAWSPDGKQVATAMLDGTTWIWNPENGRDLHIVGTWHPGKFFAPDPRVLTPITVAWAPDGRHLAFTNQNHSVEIWDLSETQPRLQRVVPEKKEDEAGAPQQPLESFDWSSDGSCIRLRFKNDPAGAVDVATGGVCRGNKEWLAPQDTRPDELVARLSEGPVRDVSWSPVSSNLAISRNDGVAIWNPTEREVADIWPAPSGTWIVTAVWLHDGLYRLSVIEPSNMKESDAGLVWDRLDVDAGERANAAARPQALQRFEGPGDWGYPDSLAFSPDGRQLVTIARDVSTAQWTLRLWDLTDSTGKTLTTLPMKARPAVRWSPDGSRLAITALDSPTQILDAATGEVLTSIAGGAAGYFGWSPNSARIAAACDAGQGTMEPQTDLRLCFYDTAGGQPVGPRLPADLTDAGDWSPDGRLFALGRKTELQIWNVEAGKLLQALHDPDGSGVLTWSPDGRMLASGRGPVSVWGIPAETELTQGGD